MLKKLGIGLLFIPVIFVLLFTLGEISSASISVLPHLLQLALLTFLIVLAIKRALIGGILLIVVSIIGGILYAISVPSLKPF